MKNNYLDRKVIIVTGASTGIGRATALTLARQGACIALASRNAALLDKAAQEIKAWGADALVVPTDVTDPAQIEALVQKTISHWGRIDILVSNAGQYIRVPILDLSIQDMERSMAVNFYSHVNIVLAVLPTMRAQHSGHILLVSSMDAKKGIPPDAPYVAAKYALGGFGEILRQELLPVGVAVTTLYPGRVDTAMIENLSVPWISAKIPAEKVANAVLQAVRRRPAEVILPLQAYPLYLLNVFSPRLADAAVRFFQLQGREK